MTVPIHRWVGLILAVMLVWTSPNQGWAMQIAPSEGRSVATQASDEAASRVPSSEKDAANELNSNNTEVPSSGDHNSGQDLTPYNPLDTYSFYLTALFILFGLGVILLQLAAMRRIANVTADEIARNCAITLVVVASVALLVSGYSSQQVAPAFGLFGTIIGYLLGKAGAKEAAAAAKPPTQPKEDYNAPPSSQP